MAFQLSSQIIDNEEHYVLVKVLLNSREVTLFNVYRPPGQHKSLIKKLFDSIATEITNILICGGDCIQSFGQIPQTQQKRTNPESPLVRKMLECIDMIDVWREVHASAKQFTFFSHPHAAYSRVDYFFNNINNNITIGTRDVSDHADSTWMFNSKALSVGLKKDLTNILKTLEQEHAELNDLKILQKINETQQELNNKDT